MSQPLLKPAYICRSCRSHSGGNSRRWASGASRRAKFVPDRPVRTRFAPSPTGHVHLGSVRTALFNYLIARRTGGQFLLRLEDTDQKRTIPGAEKRILDDLRWLGLQWDQGPEVGGPHQPYRQSERSQLYSDHAQQLVESGHAYRCFCSAESLQAKGQQRSKDGLATLYDRTCYHVPPEESKSRVENGEKHVVRLRCQDKPVAYTDLVGGPYELSRTAARRAAAQGVYDDFILMKQDGLPTYHFANVVDDHHMDITHVIRGVEWQISTPKHLTLYDAFDWQPPAFGHIGLLLNQDGTKMSKRDKTFDLRAFKESGVLPEALVNFLALHGWSHTKQSDFMTLKDLERNFNLNLSNTNPTVSLPKLWFLSPKHAVKRVEDNGKPYREMLDLVCTAVHNVMAQDYAGKTLLQAGQDPFEHREYISRVLKSDAKNYTTAAEFVKSHAYFFVQDVEITRPKDIETNCFDYCRSELHREIGRLSKSDLGWNHEGLAAATSGAITKIIREAHDKPRKKDIWKVLRALLAGGQDGPSLLETMEILGPEVVLQRLEST